MDVSVAEPPDFELSDFILAGYSGLRPNVLSVASDCGQPLEHRPGVFLLRCSAMHGDSGAPILVFKDDKYSVAGVFSAVVGWVDGYASLVVSASSFLYALRVEGGQSLTK